MLHQKTLCLHKYQKKLNDFLHTFLIIQVKALHEKTL